MAYRHGTAYCATCGAKGTVRNGKTPCPACRPAQRSCAARNKLVEENKGLAYAAAFAFVNRSRYAKRYYHPDDACQDALFGLMRAAEKYREDNGNEFSTYAAHWMKQALHAGLRRCRLVSRPAGDCRDPQNAKKRRALEVYIADLGAGHEWKGDFEFAGRELIAPLDRGEVSRLLNGALGKLHPRRAEVLRRRCRGETLQEIADSWGLTRQRVQQLAAAAEDDLRKVFREMGVTEEEVL